MNLILHCGWPKTGSSYLQHLLVRNRDNLLSHGIFYPKGIRENDALLGKISPGNGLIFSQSLMAGEPRLALKMLNNWMGDANKQGCKTVLVSYEGLITSIAQSDSSVLNYVLSLHDFNKVDCLVYTRNIGDHAISLYKHRGKNGKVPEFNEWLNKSYTIIDDSIKFNRVSSEYNLRVKWFNISHEGFSLHDNFFKNCLNIEDYVHDDNIVNKSLTLNEIEVLRRVRVVLPYLTNRLSKLFNDLPDEFKAKDKYLYEKNKFEVVNWILNYKLKAINTLENELSLDLITHHKDRMLSKISNDKVIISMTIDELDVIVKTVTRNRIIDYIAYNLKKILNQLEK